MTSRRLIRIKVLQLLYAKHKKETVTIEETERELLKSMEKSTDLYYETLLLITELRRKAFLKIDTARNRRFASEATSIPTPDSWKIRYSISSKKTGNSSATSTTTSSPGRNRRKPCYISTTTDGMAQIPAIHEQAFRDV